MREKDSSSSRMTSCTNAALASSSGKATLKDATTTGTSAAKNPVSALRNCRPYRTARRRMRRSTYPRPSFDGTAPSATANVSVRAWSAITRYAMSTPPTSSAPSLPPYGAAPVMRRISANSGAKMSVS